MQFTKFPSLENTYRQKEIDKIQSMMIKDKWIVTEKVHGANFSFWLKEEHLSVEGIGLCSTVVIKCAKRSGWIEEDEKFFNYRPVVEKYRDSLEQLYYHLSSTHGYKEIVVHGELFGGNIQSGMCYPEQQDFIAFDLKCDGIARTKTTSFTILNGFNIPTTPIIGVYNSLEDALSVDESFDSLLMREGFSGSDNHKEAEGVVIEPNNPVFEPNGSRIYLKKKTKRFLEKGGKPNVKHKTVTTCSEKVNALLTQSESYINENRLNAVTSKIGEVTIKDIVKVMGLLTQDIIVDLEKDHSFEVSSWFDEKSDEKVYKKQLMKMVQDFIKPILLQK